MTSDSRLDSYRSKLKKRLDALLPIFSKAAVGDFSENVRIPENPDELTDFLVGIQIMIDVIREKTAELEKTNVNLTHEVYRQTEEIKEKEQQLRNIVENATNLFYTQDANDNLTYISPQSEKFFDMSPEEAKRKWTTFLTDNPINKKGLELTRAAIKTGRIQQPYELELKSKRGRIIWVQVNEAPLLKKGRVVGLVGSLTDITDRKLAESELINNAKQLEQFNQLMIGRELKMIELKEQNLELKQKIRNKETAGPSPEISAPEVTSKALTEAQVPNPRITIVKAYTAIALLYCAASAWLFYLLVGHEALGLVHTTAFTIVLINYLALKFTKNYELATHIILSQGTAVVVSLFATGGWEGSGYLWPFAYLPYAFFLAKRLVAYLWVGLLYACCFMSVILDALGKIEIPYSTVAQVNFFAALTIFSGCMYLFIEAREKYEHKIQTAFKEVHNTETAMAREASRRSRLAEELEQKQAELRELNEELGSQLKHQAAILKSRAQDGQ